MFLHVFIVLFFQKLLIPLPTVQVLLDLYCDKFAPAI